MSEQWGPGPPERHGRDALIVLLLVLFGGAILMVLADRLIHFGATVGNVAFAVLPLVAVGAAATRLHHGD